MTETSTALVMRPPAEGAIQPFEPQSIREAIELAKMLVRSQLMPKHLRTPEDCLMVIMTGREMGLTVMQSIRGMHVIEGKVSLSADLMVALVKRHPECLYFRLVQTADKIAIYETQRRGDAEPTRIGYTIEQAQTAGLTGKDNWKRHPAAMLRARAAAALARAVYPDGILGIYDSDEAEEFAPRAPARQVLAEPSAWDGAAAERPASGPEEESPGVPIATDEKIHHKLCTLIHNAKTHEELAEASALLKQATRDRLLTVEERADLIDRGVNRKLALDGEAPQ